MSSLAFRRFADELMAFIGRQVVVITADGKEYGGVLVAVDERLNLVLDKVTGAAAGVHKVAMNGQSVREIRLTEKPFDYKALGERINRVFPGHVVVREDVGAVIVMEKIKVTEKGVVEGSGLSADRVRSIYDDYLRETKR